MTTPIPTGSPPQIAAGVVRVSDVKHSMVTYLLTLGCLTGMVFQVLGFPAARAPVLSALGFVLVAVGLGAYAKVKGASIGWALLAAVPFLGALFGFALLSSKSMAPNAPLNAVKGAAHAALLGTMIVAFIWMTLSGIENGATRAIQGAPPDWFPVLVVVHVEGSTDYTGYVVSIADLENFRREHPIFSFLVPEGAEASVHSTLRRYNSSRGGDFKVKRAGLGRQTLEVRYSGGERYFVGWYEASAQQGIAPKRYASWHSLPAGFFYFIMFLIAIMIYWTLAWALERWLWPRWRTDTANEIGTS